MVTGIQKDFIGLQSDEYKDAIGINGAAGVNSSIGNTLSSDNTENEPNILRPKL